MPKTFKPAIPVFAAALAGLMPAGPAQAQNAAGLQDEIIQLKGRVAKLEDSSGGGCSLDPKKFLKVKCPNTSLQIGGRIMLDAAWFTKDDIGGDSGHEFRRARLFAKGSFAKTWGWKAQFDFAGNKVSTKDMYIEYQGFKKSFNNLVIRAGHYKVPFMLQNLTSSKYIPFMERSQAYDWAGALGADRKTGLGFMMGGGNYSLAGGVFAGDASASAFKDGVTMAGRATFAPIADKTQVIHIGGGLVYRNGFADDGANKDALKLESRPEIHLAGKPISTGSIDGVDNALSYNAELAGVYGPFSLQGEYIRTKIDRKAAASKDLDFSTFYVEATWWLTGESRNYSAKKGAFGRVKPKADLSDGGPGAWMVGYRISRAVLEDEDVNGGHQNVHTAGVTWKPNPYVALKVNGHLAHGHKKGAIGADTATEKFADRGVQMRVQVDF